LTDEQITMAAESDPDNPPMGIGVGKANPAASLYGTTTLDRHARARREHPRLSRRLSSLQRKAWTLATSARVTIKDKQRGSPAPTLRLFASCRTAVADGRESGLLALSQAAFAKRYGIPLGTLRDWEQGRTRPDEAAASYIRVIEAMPDRVAKAVSAA
jgi:putative transcriptional regulator